MPVNGNGLSFSSVSRRQLVAASVALLLPLAWPAAAEQQSKGFPSGRRSVYPEPLTRTQIGRPCDVTSLMGPLADDYNTGNWPALQGTLRSLLAHCAAEIGTLAPQASYSFLFIDRPSNDKTAPFAPTAVRVLVQLWPTPSRYSLRASGRPLYDIQLLPKPADLSSTEAPTVPVTTYSAKAIQNPLFAGLPKLVAQVFPPIVKTVESLKAPTLLVKLAPIQLHVYRVEVPADPSRWEITIRDRVYDVTDDGKVTTTALEPLSTVYSLGPLTHWDLGAGAGAILGTSLNQRVKVDGGNLVDDSPKTSVLTFLAVNYHPVAFDESTFQPTWAERFRTFSGVVLTPDVGLCVGAGYSIIRGLAVHGGYGVLLSNVLRKGDHVGAMPADPLHASRHGVLGVAFAGFEYTFP